MKIKRFNDFVTENADEDEYLTAKQKKLPDGLKKGIIKKMKKSGNTVNDKKGDDKECKDDIKEKETKKIDVNKSDAENYLTPKQRKLPEGLQKGIIAKMKKNKK